MSKTDTDKIVTVLNRILEAELAGVVRYTHYSFLVFGFGRIPIVSWLHQQANESLLHAQQVDAVGLRGQRLRAQPVGEQPGGQRAKRGPREQEGDQRERPQPDGFHGVLRSDRDHAIPRAP